MVTLAPIIASVASLLVSGAVGIYAVRVAIRQSKTAENRLKFDLFTKRFELWEAANTGIDRELERIGNIDQFGFDGAAASSLSMEYYRAKREAMFFFGREVMEIYPDIEGALSTYFVARRQWMESTAGPPLATQLEMAMHQAAQDVREHKARLGRAVEPYLDLAHIAVLPPSARRRVGWRIGRLFR